MSWTVRQTRRFGRVYKKLHPDIAREVNRAVARIADDPDLGQRKKGDLAELWVYKFRSRGQLWLLGYTRDDGIRLIWLEALGPHENFYRDLKRR